MTRWWRPRDARDSAWTPVKSLGRGGRLGGAALHPWTLRRGGGRGQLPHADAQTGVPAPARPPSSTSGNHHPWAAATALPASTPSPWERKPAGCPNWQRCTCKHQPEQERRWGSNASPGKGSPPVQPCFATTGLSREVFLSLLKRPRSVSCLKRVTVKMKKYRHIFSINKFLYTFTCNIVLRINPYLCLINIFSKISFIRDNICTKI